jgi:hypothetical protein
METDGKQVSEAEKKDRIIITKLLHRLFDYVDTVFEEDRYKHHDIIATISKLNSITKKFYEENKLVIEIKSRNNSISDYDTSLMEVDKYNYLMNTIEFKDITKIYAVIYPVDNAVYVFNLNKINIDNVDHRLTWCNSATLLYNRDTIKKNIKDCYYLPFSIGTKFELDCSQYYDIDNNNNSIEIDYAERRKIYNDYIMNKKYAIH